MTDRLNLPRRYRRIVEALLREHVPDAEVWAYGSRVNGESHEGSDLDLVVRGPDLKRIPSGPLADLIDALEESNVPILVQTHDWARLPKSFHQEIEREYVVVQGGVKRGTATFADEWIHCTLADACSAINYGLTASASSTSDGPKFLRITDIVSGQIDWNSVPHVDASEEILAKYRLSDGDIVIARTGASTGKSTYVKNSPPSVFASYLVRLRAKPEFNARFIAYFLKSSEFEMYIHGVLGDKSAQPNASASTMTAAPLRIPSNKEEQRAIGHVLGTLDDKIELNRRMNETLEEMARALFRSWFVDFDPVRAKMEGRWRQGESLPGLPAEHYDLFPDRLVVSELGEIPEGWEVRTLGDVAEQRRVGVGPENIDPSAPYIALEHMPKHCIALGNWNLAKGLASGKFRFEQGDILFGKLRPYFHKVGVAPLDGVCSTDIVVISPKGGSWFGFVLGHVSSSVFVDYTDAASTGTKMPRTKWADMARYKVVLPDIAVANALAVLNQPCIDQILSAIHESNFLSNLRESLLPKLVSGDVRIKGVGSVL